MKAKVTVKTSVLVVAFLIAFGNLSYAQSRTFTLKEAIETALKNNREVRIAKLEVDKAAAAVDEAFGYALPTADFSAGFSRFLEKPRMPFPDFQAMLQNSIYGVLFQEKLLPYNPNKFLPLETKLQSFAQRNNFQVQAQVTQILFNSAVFRGIGASQIYLNLSKIRLKGAISKTVFDVKKAFYGVLLAKEMLNITRERFKNAQENLQTIQAMQKQGLVSDYDAMQAQVQVENIKPAVTQLENVYKNALNGFKILLGLNQESQIEITGTLTYSPANLPPEKELLEEALKSNFDIQTLKTKRQVDEEFIEIDRSSYWPTLVAFGNYSYNGMDEKYDFKTYSSATIGLNLSLNIFEGLRAYHKVQQDKIATMQTDEQIKNLKDYIATQLKATVAELTRIREQIEAMERNVKLAEKAYKIANVRYKEGDGTQLEVKNAAVELSVAKTNRIKAIHDYAVAQARLDNILGKLNPNYVSFVKKYLEK